MNLLGFGVTIMFFFLMVSLIVWAVGGWNEVLAFWGFRSWVRQKPKIQLVESELLKPYPRRDYDQEIEDILKEAEKMREELPLVTLWWGLDGLQMNRDGTLEWISKKPKQVEKYWLGPDLIHSYPIPEYPLGCAKLYQPILYGFNCQNSTPEDRISFLENEQYRLQMTQAQGYQTRAILNALNSCELVDILGNTYTEQIR